MIGGNWAPGTGSSLLVALLALGTACQSSLDLDQYSFGAGAMPAESLLPSNGTSAAGMDALGGTQPSPPAGSTGQSGSEGTGGGGTTSVGGVGGTAGSGGSSAAGAANAAVGASLKVCPDEELLLDDMEEEPARICPHYGRSATEWYSFVGSSADTVSATLSPMPFAYEAIPGGRMGSQRAIHVVMSTLDTTDYAGFGVDFSVATLKLPFDASGYGGVSFYARGSGTVLVRLSTAETVTVAAGGRCVKTGDELCYNDHNVVLELTAAWQLYQYSFADFMPASYGPEREFDPAELFSFLISQEPGQSDIDIWVDDIWFLPGQNAPR
jgi:hypothetical protein